MKCYILDTGEVMNLSYVSPLKEYTVDLSLDLYELCVLHDKEELYEAEDIVNEKIDAIMSYEDYVWWNGLFNDLIEAEELQINLKNKLPKQLYKELEDKINDEFLCCELSERPDIIKSIISEYED